MFGMSDEQDNAWWKQPGVAPLVAELVRVRSIGVDRLADIRRTELPLLKRHARAQFPNARFDGDAIRSLLTMAIKELSYEEPRLSEAAQYELGLLPNPGFDKQTSNTRRQAAADALGYSWSSFRHDPALERALLEKTAEAVEQAGRRVDSGEYTVGGGRFIARPALSQRIEAAHQECRNPDWQRRGLIFIYGEPGVGSSRIAHEHFWSHDAVRLPADSDDVLLLAMCRVLDRYKKRTPGDTAGIRHQFGRLLSSGTGPSVVVLDDVDKPESVLNWLPDRLRCQVVMVTRKPPPVGVAPVVEVGPMLEPEALALFADRCPELKPELAWRLAKMFGGRAQALEQLAQVIHELAEVDSEELVAALLADPAKGLDASATSVERSLTGLYRAAVREVEQIHPYSLAILDFLAFVGHRNVTERCLMAFIARDVRNAMTASARLEFIQRARPLLALGLLHRDGDRYYLDPLTARLVRQWHQGNGAKYTTAQVCLTIENKDTDSDLSFFDLVELAWSAADIAAFYTCISTALMRLDIRGLTSDEIPIARQGASLDVAVSEAATATWKAWYFLLCGMDLDANMALTQWKLHAFTPGKMLIGVWLRAADGIAMTGDAPLSLMKLFEKDVELEILNEWLVKHGQRTVKGGSRREHAQFAFRMYSIFIWGEAERPDIVFGQARPSDDELVECCLNMGRMFPVVNRWRQRGARLQKKA